MKARIYMLDAAGSPHNAGLWLAETVDDPLSHAQLGRHPWLVWLSLWRSVRAGGDPVDLEPADAGTALIALGARIYAVGGFGPELSW